MAAKAPKRVRREHQKARDSLEVVGTPEKKPEAPRVKITKRPDGVLETAVDHPDQLQGIAHLMVALGTTDIDFFQGLFAQIVSAANNGLDPDEKGVNFMIGVIKGIEPRDQVETMLAAQMAAVHAASMTMARRLAHVDNIPQQDSAERAFNKLTRTFAAQMEALKRYRTGGQQRITVERVTVNDGGQAIVGNVSSGGRGRRKKGQPTP